MFVTLNIVGGDFPSGKCYCDVNVNSGELKIIGGMSLQTASVVQVTEETKGKLMRTAGWGLLGYAALGPFGAFAGMLGTRSKTEVCLAYTSTDGKRFLATTDLSSYQKLVAASLAAPTHASSAPTSTGSLPKQSMRFVDCPRCPRRVPADATTCWGCGAILS